MVSPPTISRPEGVVAAVDVGSNSIKMTVARSHPSGGFDELASASETVRLGIGIERSGRLADDRVEAALATLHRFAVDARALGSSRLLGVATEAVRVATNGAEFLDRVHRETGWSVRTIDGDEEADLTFRGLAVSVDTSGSLVAADIGGASTEVIVAHDGVVAGARSLPIGSGRLTDRLVHHDPPTSAEVSACRDAVRIALDGLQSSGMAVPSGHATRLVVVGGTGEYLARLIGAQPIDRSTVSRARDRLQSIPAATLAADLGIGEARARVLPAGVAAVQALIDRIEPGRIEIARSGIRAGLLLQALTDTGAVSHKARSG